MLKEMEKTQQQISQENIVIPKEAFKCVTEISGIR